MGTWWSFYEKKSVFLASWPIRELLWIGAGRPYVWPTDRLSAPQAYQCKITKSTVMATQMQLEVILARNRTATGVLWSRIPVLIYAEILGRENWEQVKSRIGGEATRARVCLFTKPCNMSDLKVLTTKLGSAKTIHFCVYLNFHTKEFPKFALI